MWFLMEILINVKEMLPSVKEGILRIDEAYPYNSRFSPYYSLSYLHYGVSAWAQQSIVW